MSYTKKAVAIAISISLVLSPLAWAEKDNVPQGPEQERLMPPSIVPDPGIAKGRIGMLNDIELFDRKIQKEIYYADGTLASVLYSGNDGTDLEVRYSYAYDENGNLKACTLTANNGVSLTIAKGYKDENGYYKIETSDSVYSARVSSPQLNSEDEIYFLIINNDSEASRKEREASDDDGPIILPLSSPRGNDDRNPLKDIATNPVDPDLLELFREAAKKVFEEDRAAYEEYTKNTAPYYQKIHTELNRRFGNSGLEDINFGKYMNKLTDGDITEEEKRVLIDEAVVYIRSEAQKEKNKGIIYDEFLVYEKKYREEFLDFGKEIYDRKIEKALEYIYAMIDKLLNSRVALYLNSKKDKIDAIINLPEITNNIEAE